MEFRQSFTERAAMDRIDRERGRLQGPQKGAEPVASPGVPWGLNLTLDLQDGEDHPVCVLQRGGAYVDGELVRVKDRIRITEESSGSVEWMRSRAPNDTFWVYLGTDGTVSLDSAPGPKWNRDDQYWAHPRFVDRRNVGHVYVSRQNHIVFATPRRQADALVTVSSVDHQIPAEYYCRGENDEIIINAAATYLFQRFGSGTIRLSPGGFSTSAAINLVGPFVILEGSGRSTVVTAQRTLPDPWDADATYEQGDMVRHEGSTWRAASAPTGAPGEDTAWRRVTPARWATNPEAMFSITGGQDIQQGNQGSQVRDLLGVSGVEGPDPLVTRERYFLGWGGAVGSTEESGGESRFVSPFQGNFPALLVGLPGETAADTGAERLVVQDGGARGQQVISLQRANGEEWVNQITLQAGDPVDSILRMIDFLGNVRVRIRANPSGGSIRFAGPETAVLSSTALTWSRGGDRAVWDFSGNLEAVGNVEAGANLQAGQDVVAARDVDVSRNASIRETLRSKNIIVGDRVTTEWLQANERVISQKNILAYQDIETHRAFRFQQPGGVVYSESWSDFVSKVITYIDDLRTFMVSGSQQFRNASRSTRGTFGVGYDDINLYHYAQRIGNQVQVWGTQLKFPGVENRRQRHLIQRFNSGSPTIGFVSICFMRIQQY